MSQASLNSFMRVTASDCGVCQKLENCLASSGSSMTEMSAGIWNTLPPHTHVRRTEIYLYFDLPGDAVVFHMMGTPDATRHMVVRDGEVALSPSWSIHSGCGTSNYTFCWAMGGENQEFADMQGFEMTTLR